MKILLALASLLLSSTAFANAALAVDNCENVKEGVIQQWGAFAWGPGLHCFNPTPELALQGGRLACLALLGQGVLGRAEYREVHLWLGGPKEGTIEIGKAYLGYCAGNRPATTLDPAKAEAQHKELDAKIRK